MLTTRIAGQSVRLPDPDRIEIPAIRDALLTATELAGHADDDSPREVALLQSLRRAVLDQRERWAAKAHRDAEIAIHKLAHAIDLAEEAQADLRDSVGVAGMIARLSTDHSAPLVVVEKPYGYRFDLAPAIRGLLEALAAVSAEVAAINAASTPDPSDDLDNELPAVSEPHSAAQTITTASKTNRKTTKKEKKA